MKQYIIYNKTFPECREFYKSYEWKKIRQEVIKTHEHKCVCCNVKLTENTKSLNVDHILPLKFYWDQRLDLDNLQILCNDCNKAKGSKYRPDWQNIVLETRFEEYITTLPEKQSDELLRTLRLLIDEEVASNLNRWYLIKKQLPSKTKSGFVYSLNTWANYEAIKKIWKFYINA